MSTWSRPFIRLEDSEKTGPGLAFLLSDATIAHKPAATAQL